MNVMMKRLTGVIGLLALLLCVTTASAQFRQTIKASSNYQTKEQKIGNFDRIELLGSPTVIYTQSTNGKSELKITGSDNLLDVVECKVANNLLTVKFKNNLNIQFGKVGRLKIMVSSPSLKDVQLSGSGDVILMNVVKCTKLNLSLAGSGDIKADEIVCTSDFSATLQGSGDIAVKKNLQASNVTLKLAGSGDLGFRGIKGGNVLAELQGSGDVTLAGTARQAKLVLSNSGDLDARNLNAVDVDARLNGSGNISCSASGNLRCSINGSGDISYKGNPSNVESSGRSKPRKL